jgi:hypothetical protein
VRPEVQDIAVPPFLPGTEWIGPEPPAVERVCARGPLLVQFLDAAHLNGVRTVPYLNAWHERYRDLGLTVIGVNSPRFPFTGDRDKLSAALARLAVVFPVAVDSRYRIWHDYGCHGWPSLFLWGRGGVLRWFHFGEGEYRSTEEAIQGELEAANRGVVLPEPLAPLRPSDAPDALVAPPTDEVFPGGSESDPWVVQEGDIALELDYEAGGAWATLDGRGTVGIALDGGPELELGIDVPGAYELAAHDHHERHHLNLRPSPGIEVYAVSFPAGITFDAAGSHTKRSPA